MSTSTTSLDVNVEFDGRLGRDAKVGFGHDVRVLDRWILLLLIDEWTV